MDRIYTPHEVAERWGCCPNTVRNVIMDGHLAAFRVGRLLRIPVSSIEEFERKGGVGSLER